MKKQIALLYLLASCFAIQAQAPAVFKVDVAHPGADISPSRLLAPYSFSVFRVKLR